MGPRHTGETDLKGRVSSNCESTASTAVQCQYQTRNNNHHQAIFRSKWAQLFFICLLRICTTRRRFHFELRLLNRDNVEGRTQRDAGEIGSSYFSTFV